MSTIYPPLFPQTNASEAVKRSLNYWRLFGKMETSGDIVECDVSSQAIVVGADSDLSRYEILYPDTSAPFDAFTTEVSVRKPFVGRVTALNNEKYRLTNEPARILVSTTDLLPPPDYEPEALVAGAPVNIILPIADLYFYFNQQNAVIGPRKDKVWQFDQLASDLNTQGGWILFPYYGRRTAQVSLKSLGFAAQPEITATVWGVNFSPVITDPTGTFASNGHQEQVLASFTIPVPDLNVGISRTVTVENQFFDYLGVEIAPAAGLNAESLALHVAVSDQ